MTVHQPELSSGLLVKHRLFVALRPDPAVAPLIARHRDAGDRTGAVSNDRLHMTLFVSDDFETEPVALAAGLKTALDRVAADAFDVVLQRFGHQGATLEPARAPALRRFQRQVADGIARAGITPRAGWNFHPHVSLAYRASPERAGRPIAPIAWRATDFVLIHSLLRLTMHRTLGTWPLIEQPRLL